MSGATSAIVVGGMAAAAAATAYGAYESKRQGDRQQAAAREQLANAKKAENAQDQAFNRENQKTPDISGILDANTSMGNTSQLVGAGGSPIDPNTLGKGNGLLGG